MKLRFWPDKFQAGFSLIEVLISLFITGAIVLVIANVPNAIRLVTGSQSESKVRQVVAKKIEDLRLTGYDNLANGTAAISDTRLDSLSQVSGNVVISDCSENVNLCPSGELAKKVVVTITWIDNKKPKRFSVSTLIAKGGLK